jgi:hypothetical protein
MLTFATIINSVILLFISALHFYWAVGGKWGIAVAVPSSEGKKIFNPNRFACLIVAVGLSGMAYLFIVNLFNIVSFLPIRVQNYGIIGIGLIFLIRAVGDFRYVGFSKTIRNTAFAQLDTWYYSPLCLLLSVNSWIVIIAP